MITLIDNALALDDDCQLVCCHFDPSVLERESLATIESSWGIALPEKLHKAVPKRKAEFIAGRFCARHAMTLLNIQTAGETFNDIPIGEKRQPLWPRGITGSITHSHGYAAAAVAGNHTIRSIGIDSEHTIKSKTANNVASHILISDENFADNRDIVDNSDRYLTLIFSAKESIFKCLYPLVEQYFDFKDAKITLSADTPNRFQFTLRKTLTDEFCEGFQGEGLFKIDGDFVHTAVTLKN